MSGNAKRYLITGCSGAGKSTLIDALAQRGFATIEESGRKIVQEQLAMGGDALPWKDQKAFGGLLAEGTLETYHNATQTNETTFFDRGFPDVMAWFEQIGSNPPKEIKAAINASPYQQPIFLLPPWKEIYAQDDERPKSFAEAQREYKEIVKTLKRLSWSFALVQPNDINTRIEFILARIQNS